MILLQKEKTPRALRAFPLTIDHCQFRKGYSRTRRYTIMKQDACKEDLPDLLEVHSDCDDEDQTPSFSIKGIYTKYHPTTEELETWKPQNCVCRRRMHTMPLENPSSTKEYEPAMFVPRVGLVGKAKFWHESDKSTKSIREDRAVLFQSQENYEKVMKHERFNWCFQEISYMEYPTFGEQVIVNGIDTSILAVGDVFEIEGGLSPLVVEITSPRKPCVELNYKHDTYNGTKGIQHYVHHNNMAGWFARVLVAGELKEGMKFIRTKQPNPKWTLDYVHRALYREGTIRESRMRVASWKRDRKELKELIALPQLGEYEWKVEARKQLLKLDGFDWKKECYYLIDPQTEPKIEETDVIYHSKFSGLYNVEGSIFGMLSKAMHA